MEIRNETPFPATQAVLFDRNGGEVLVVTLKASYSVAPDGRLRPAEPPVPICLADRHRGEPDRTSILEEAEAGPPKPATDVFLRAHAVAPRPGTTSLVVSFRCGPLAKQVVVFGKRVWDKRLLVARGSDPEPFERIPLAWENAFGGRDDTPEKPEHRCWEPRNPVGRGFFAPKSRARVEGMELPNIEDPRDLLKSVGQQVEPQGFTPVGRHWEPRAKYAGTYDGKWLDERMPLLPADFDERHHTAAPPGLVAAGWLAGDEELETAGVRDGGPWRLRLPGLRPACTVLVGGSPADVLLRLETVTLDADAAVLTLVHKGALPIHGKVTRLRRTDLALGGAPR